MATNSTQTPKVANTVAPKLFQSITPRIWGAETRGARITVDKGLTTFLFCLPKKRISKKRIRSWWKCKRSGLSAGLPNFQRRHIAKPVSATGQKNIRNMANELISFAWLNSKIADHTSKWPKTYAPASPKKIFPKGKFNIKNPAKDAINKAKKMTNCKLFTLKAIIESDKAIEILT